MVDLVAPPVRLPLCGLLLLALPVVAACTDDVETDVTGDGGAGGTTAAGGAGGGSGACDAAPQPVGQLEDAECMSSWDSQNQMCEVSCDDEANNAFTVRCGNGHCECVHNQQVICECDADHTNSCQDHCCPPPWKQ